MSHFSSLILIVVILTNFMGIVGSLKCYQCTTLWDMGCWYKWETLQLPSIETKHLRPCPGDVTSCVKESIHHKYLTENYYGYNPYVRRGCSETIERKSKLPDSCTKEEVEVVVANHTLRVEQTTCYCSTDSCNAGYRLHILDPYFHVSSTLLLLTIGGYLL